MGHAGVLGGRVRMNRAGQGREGKGRAMGQSDGDTVSYADGASALSCSCLRFRMLLGHKRW